jgi:ferrochelatase
LASAAPLPSEACLLLLVNTGTPAAPRRAAVRRFLARFLSDPRVVEIPRLLWLPLLYLLVLPLRSGTSAHRYRLIWQADGSPLAANTGRISAALERELADLGTQIQVRETYLYSDPAFMQVLDTLRERQLRRLVVLPLFPQSSGTTTGALYDQLGAALSRWRTLPQLRVIADYGNDDAYIAALASSVRAHQQRRGEAHAAEHLLISFHGIPRRCELRGDRYGEQCRQTAERLAAALGLSAGQWTLTYQSRFGAQRWLGPATDATLRELPARGIRAVAIVCPGFPADCLETLEEIALLGRDTFLKAGGERFDYISALNDAELHVRALAALVQRATSDWTQDLAG